MDKMSPYLWLMSMQSHTNISALHRQRLKGREIIVTEDPKLHLVWFQDCIFLKPLPAYLCSHEFWLKELSPATTDPRRLQIRSHALGYLRTWFLLIKHESDHRIALKPDLQLIPPNLDWVAFCRLSARFDQIKDIDVCERYHYGEIRLRRLNFYGRFILGRRLYQRMYTQYGGYFARLYGPLLFCIAILSVMLNAMQVVISVEQVASLQWRVFWSVSRWSGVVCSVVILLIMLALLLIAIIKLYSEWIRALSDRYQNAKQRKRSKDIEKQEAVGPRTS